ncbi:hypothetical protein [Xenorhabdus griffiniae]|uniref:hypothetical protein n=1 Tax=Xenorhabdus griffiniae TaxID=351672 RepID=UPI0023590A98|nr:hypothetical protein [Xenorhabdus griffiniae]MDC9607047.1 hypothetical protein [Xenorhabdus griffiniae]
MFKFAHLLGTKARATDEREEDEKARKAKSRAEEEEDEKDAEEDDPDAEDEDDEKEGKKAKKAKKAESEDDDPDAEDDDDADAGENENVKKGRRAERKRCASIFGSKYAAGRPDIAAHLAFNTKMSASEAISTLKAVGAVQPAPARVSLDSRMRTEQQVRLGPDAQQPAKGSAAALAQQMTGLYNTNRGTK